MASGDSFFTWEALSAMGGASLLTFFIVQYSKSFIKMQTDLYAVIVSYFVLLSAQFALGASVADWRVYALTFANSFLVAAAAGQMFNKAIKPPVGCKDTQPVVTLPDNTQKENKGDVPIEKIPAQS